MYFAEVRSNQVCDLKFKNIYIYNPTMKNIDPPIEPF
jgi:hypothetical protein